MAGSTTTSTGLPSARTGPSRVAVGGSAEEIAEAVRKGEVEESTLDESVRRLLRIILRSGATPQGMPIPGTVLARQYRGRQIQVTVLPKGFEFEGQIYRSLTAVAKAVGQNLLPRVSWPQLTLPP